MKMKRLQMGHLSLDTLVRAKDLKGRDQSDAGQDHTDQCTCACRQAGFTELHVGQGQQSAQHMYLGCESHTCRAGWHTNVPRALSAPQGAGGVREGRPEHLNPPSLNCIALKWSHLNIFVVVLLPCAWKQEATGCGK